jgi:hypothetical protein
MEHYRLGHPSQKRQTVLDIDKQTKPEVSKLACPTCLASKSRKSNRPPPSQKEERSQIQWDDIHSDLSGKIATQSTRGYKYFVVFVCTYTGAEHVEFLSHKNQIIHTRTVALSQSSEHTHEHSGRSRNGIPQQRDDDTLLETNYVRHVVAAVNEHYSNGAAEHAIHTTGEPRPAQQTRPHQANADLCDERPRPAQARWQQAATAPAPATDSARPCTAAQEGRLRQESVDVVP